MLGTVSPLMELKRPPFLNFHRSNALELSRGAFFGSLPPRLTEVELANEINECAEAIPREQ